jgi:hypothetical protein
LDFALFVVPAGTTSGENLMVFIVGLWRNGSAPAWHGRFAKRKGHIVQEAGGSKARIAAKSLWRFDEYAERQEFGNLTALRAVNPPESISFSIPLRARF